MDQLFAYAIAFIISMGFVASAGSSIPAGLNLQALETETQQLNNLGAGYQSGCDATTFVCGSGGVPAIKTGAASSNIWGGYVSVVPNGTPIGGKPYNIVVNPDSENPAQNTVLVYADYPVVGDLLGSFTVYSITAGTPPTVKNNGLPVSGTSYYLVYDKCLSGIYASIAVPTLSACP